MARNSILFAGTANPPLATAIADHLGMPVGACTIEQFPDGETAVRLLEPVRRKEAFLVQPLSPPVNSHLVELLAMADACRRAGAARITAVVPYFGYARSDKRHGKREPVMARVVADLLETVGIGQIVTLDLHAPQIEGFFHIPMDSLTAVPTLCEMLRTQVEEGTAVVAPDAGALRLATEYAHRLGGAVVVTHKRRETGTHTQVTHLVGDVRNKPCLIVDDMISTGGTIAACMDRLRQAGARPHITVAATHGLFLSGAQERLEREGLRNVFVSDTVGTPIQWTKLHVVSIAPVIATALKRFMQHRSIAELY